MFGSMSVRKACLKEPGGGYSDCIGFFGAAEAPEAVDMAEEPGVPDAPAEPATSGPSLLSTRAFTGCVLVLETSGDTSGGAQGKLSEGASLSGGLTSPPLGTFSAGISISIALTISQHLLKHT